MPLDTTPTSLVHHALDCDERAEPWQANARCILCDTPIVVRLLLLRGGSTAFESFELEADGDPRGPRALCVAPTVLALDDGGAGHHRVHRCY